MPDDDKLIIAAVSVNKFFQLITQASQRSKAAE
jgi:hypothetical protein